MLFPLAGLDPARAEEYYDDARAHRSPRLRRQRGGAPIPQRRDLARRTRRRGWRPTRCSPAPRAEQRVRFFDQYRSYVINYNLGKDLVRAYIEARGGTADNPARRWAEFGAAVSRRRACRPAAGRARAATTSAAGTSGHYTRAAPVARRCGTDKRPCAGDRGLATRLSGVLLARGVPHAFAWPACAFVAGIACGIAFRVPRPLAGFALLLALGAAVRAYSRADAPARVRAGAGGLARGGRGARVACRTPRAGAAASQRRTGQAPAHIRGPASVGRTAASLPRPIRTATPALVFRTCPRTAS